MSNVVYIILFIARFLFNFFFVYVNDDPSWDYYY